MDKKALTRLLAGEIKKARIATGKTQLAVLNDTGIDIGRIERGTIAISICTFFALCQYLHADSSEIVEKIEKI